MDKAAVGPALGMIPSGLSVLVSSLDGRPVAMLGSWIQQASFDPPIVTASVKSGRPLEQALAVGATVSISLLAETNMNLAVRFSKGDGALDGLDLFTAPGGHPVLKSALAWLDGKVLNRVAAADHVVVLIEVTAGGVLQEGSKPRVHLRKSGFSY